MDYFIYAIQAIVEKQPVIVYFLAGLKNTLNQEDLQLKQQMQSLKDKAFMLQ